MATETPAPKPAPQVEPPRLIPPAEPNPAAENIIKKSERD